MFSKKRRYCDHIASSKKRPLDRPSGKNYEGENETYIEASAENSGSTLYDKEIRDKPRTRHTKRNV
nr:MAG TPA: hypothetical protein [Caudoviricetes sp.]